MGAKKSELQKTLLRENSQRLVCLSDFISMNSDISKAAGPTSIKG